MARRAVDFGLVWDGSSLQFLFDQSRVQDNPEFAILARRIGRGLELRLAEVSAPVIPEKVHVEKLSAATWFHHIVPGLMALAILQAGVFAGAGRLSAMRERGILRRMVVTPISGWAILLGVGLVRMLVGFVSAGLNLFVARTAFGLSFPGDWGSVLFYAVCGGLGALGLGVVAGVPETIWAALGFGLFGFVAFLLFGQRIIRPERG